MTDTTSNGDDLPFSHPIRPADLPTKRATRFELVPSPAQCAAIARDLGLVGLKKLRFTGEVSPLGKHDWQMEAHLGATVTQPCVVSLDPVTTRIEEEVERRWLKHLPELDHGDEVEMPEDDTIEALRDVIDLGQVMTEALALALPLYPRADGAAMSTTVYAAPGVTPMTDEDAKPFAGLSGLRDKLSGKDE